MEGWLSFNLPKGEMIYGDISVRKLTPGDP